MYLLFCFIAYTISSTISLSVIIFSPLLCPFLFNPSFVHLLEQVPMPVRGCSNTLQVIGLVYRSQPYVRRVHNLVPRMFPCNICLHSLWFHTTKKVLLTAVVLFVPIVLFVFLLYFGRLYGLGLLCLPTGLFLAVILVIAGIC